MRQIQQQITNKQVQQTFANKPTIPATKLNAYPVENKKSSDLERISMLIEDILPRCRNHNSLEEQDFADWLFTQLPDDSYADAFGNIHYINGPTKTMFSAHIDTMHTNTGNAKQKLLYDSAKDHLFCEVGGECLGADDGTGVWIMLQMIKAEIKGHYIFHRAEERGGQGSSWIASKKKALIKSYDRAIAFDRKDKTDIITHQGTRTASDKFADALAKQLNELDNSFKFEKSDGGTFTDTKTYAKIIPECTNISVGYKHQHGPNEYQEVGFLVKLMDALLKIDWEKLPTERNPAKDNDSKFTQYQPRQPYNKQRHAQQPKYPSHNAVKTPAVPKKDSITLNEATMLVERFPEIAAELLHQSDMEWGDALDQLAIHFEDEFNSAFNFPSYID